MAQLHIQEKQGGANWVWWIVGLIVLALIVWWIISAVNGPDRVATAPVATPAPVAVGVVAPVGTSTAVANGAVTTGPITDLSVLTGPSVDTTMVGRQVALTSVPVERAVSDKGFWAGSGTNDVFIVRGNQSASYTAPNGAADKGASVNVWGTVMAMPSDLTQQATTWNLSSTDKTKLGQQKVYVSADSVRLAQP